MTKVEERDSVVTEALFKNATKIGMACLGFDCVPPYPKRTEDEAVEAFFQFVGLLKFCGDHKMFRVRENAINKILSEIESTFNR